MTPSRGIVRRRVLAVVCSVFAAAISCSAADGSSDGTGASTGSHGGNAGTNVLLDGGGDSSMTTCATSTATASLLPSYLQFLCDTSGSMNCQPTDPPSVGCDPGDPQSKWMLTGSALESAVATLPSATSAGVITYPNSNGGNCFSNKAAVPLAALDDAQKQLIEQVLNSLTPGGATPTEDAYLFAIQTFASIQPDSNKYIVLITDGMPTISKGCQGDGYAAVPTAPLITDAAEALAQGIRTFVIGSPGSEGFRSDLSKMASSGGTAQPGCSDSGPDYCHLDLTTQPDFGKAIADALNAIASQTISCVFNVPDPEDGGTIDPNLVNVIYTPSGGTPEYIPQDNANPCSSGWHYSSDKKQIILCDDTCKTVQADQGASMTIEFGCQTKVS
jgi:hypothetical protein